MSKKKVKIGLVCFSRNTFDYEAAEELYNEIKQELLQRQDIDLVAIDKPIMEDEEAISCGKDFESHGVNAIAMISGTFHLGHLALEIKKYCDKPLLLWALPELPYNGGKIRLNSVCGVNLNASNLIKSGISDFIYHIGQQINEDWLDAIRIIEALKESKIGLIGYRAKGFFNVGIDELSLYKNFGTLVDHYELQEVWKYPFSEEDLNKYIRLLKDEFKQMDSNREKIIKVAELSARIKAFVEDKNLSALAVRCWPEFADGYGIAPCASMSIVQSQGYILACEGDIDCAITMIAHKAIGAETPFMADLSQVDIKNNSALMWHCGVAPCNLKNNSGSCTLDEYHAGGRGMTVGFVMKEGDINITRLDSINGQYRLFHQKGRALKMEKLLSGTYAKIEFDMPMDELLDKVIYSGIAHHVSMVYGDYTKPLQIFSRLKGITIMD